MSRRCCGLVGGFLRRWESWWEGRRWEDVHFGDGAVVDAVEVGRDFVAVEQSGER